MSQAFTIERWTAIERAFLDACEQPEEQRATYLRSCHGHDPEFLTAVLRLLAADAPEGGMVDRTAEEALRGPDPLPGSRFGPFRLLERIAEGGMGTVYRAERADSDFQQDVAVKVLRLGLSPSMRERFARERQMLARLVHPNVARLLDGGTNEHGVPFIAMERIDGLPIDRHADDHRLTLRERLQLFVVVCRAVQFAHSSLVVHLDLKPSNILVDTSGVPKLLDFGVAGLLEGVGADDGVSATRSRPFTPEYASPEQLRGEPVSTAADVYALGVVLYELLSGVRPFRGNGDLELARAVCETDAMRPSATCSPTRAGEGRERAARRGLPAAPALARELRGDLDRIVLTALQKDPAHRYRSCEAFADDVERFLGGFPVHAREPRLGYRLQRFVARNRIPVAAAALAILALLGGFVATLHMAAVARSERDEAEAARRRAEREEDHARIEATSSGIVATMLGDTFLSADFVNSSQQQGRVRAALLARAAQVRRQYGGAEQAHLRANLLDALGRACTAVAAFADAKALLDEAHALRVAHFGNDSLERALSLTSLGRLYYQQGRFDDAAGVLDDCYRLHKTCTPGVHTDVATAANDLAAAERAAGRRERARALHEEALRLRGGSDGAETVATAESLNNLANVEDDAARAAGHLQRALAIRERLLGSDDPLTIQSRVNLARLLMNGDDLAAAQPLLQAAIAAARRLGALGADALAQALTSFAYAELRLERPEAALAAIDEALQLDRERFQDAHPRLAAELDIRARIHLARRDQATAIADWRETLRLRRELLPPGHRDIAATLASLATAMTSAGAAAEALPLFEEALASHLAAVPPRLADVVHTRMEMALALERAGRLAESEQALLDALAACSGAPAPSGVTATLRRRLSEFYTRTGHPAEAARYLAPAGDTVK